jgi:hypothetical protein
MSIIRLYFEGDDDSAVLQGLKKAKLLPGESEIAERDKKLAQGKDGLVKQLFPFISPANGVGGKAVVLIDLDSLSLALQRGFGPDR